MVSAVNAVLHPWLKEQLSQVLSEIIKQQPQELPEENAPKQSSGTFQFSSADKRLGTPCSLHYGDTMPRKMSVLPNVVGHWVITLGLPAVPARKASTAAHAVASRESVHTA